MAVELASAYVSLVVDTRRIPGQINGAMNAAQSQMSSQGEGMGDKLASGLGTAFKVGAAATMATAGGVAAAAFTKGFGRLKAIDDAQGKLTALGNDTAGVAAIMDSALASVKGTSYGLGDAANIAASAVAAGVKPGKDLTRYLGLTADAASIAGTSLAEMGQIINKVQTSGTAYTMEITQLADRGLPIWQWLAAEMGVTAGEMKGLVAEGKVDSATYLKAIEKNIGGAATAATTVSSAYSNMNAALGRVGAEALKPTFARLIGGLTGVTGALDTVTPKVTDLAESFDQKVFEEWAPKMIEAGGAVKTALAEFSETDMARDSLRRVTNVIAELLEAGQDARPAIESIVTSLAQASGALGVSSWQVLLAILESTAAIANSVLVPALDTTASLMEDNQVAVTSLVAAFLLFKTMPALVGRIAPPLDKLRATVAATAGTTAAANGGLTAYQRGILGTANAAGTARTGLSNFGREVRLTQDYARAAGRPLGTMSASLLTLQSSAVGATGAMGRLKSGASAAVGALGGPVGVGITAALIAVPQLISAAKNWDEQAKISSKASDDVAESQTKMADAFFKSAGSVDDSVMAQITGQTDTLLGKLRDTSESAPGFWEKELAPFKNVWSRVQGGSGSIGSEQLAERAEMAEAAKSTLEELSNLRIGSDQLSQALAGSDGGWRSFIDRITATGEVSADTIADLNGMREAVEKQRAAAQNVTPGIVELASQIGVLADEASSADDKSSALKRTLEILAGVPAEASAAMSDYNKVVREVKDSLSEPVDATLGIGEGLGGVEGILNGATENGAAMRAELEKMLDATVAAGAAGNDLGPIFENNRGIIDSLAERFQVLPDVVDAVAEHVGYLPDAIEFAVRVEGATGVTAELGTLSLMADKLTDGEKVVKVNALTEDAQAKLDAADVAWQKIGEGDSAYYTIDLNDADARSKLDGFVQAGLTLADMEFETGVKLDTTEFENGTKETRGLIEALGALEAEPGARLLLDELKAGKSIAVEDLLNLSNQVADPKAVLDIAKLLTDKAEAERLLDQIANVRRVAQIVVEVQERNPNGYGPNNRNFGEALAERFPVQQRANGGIDRLPEQATIKNAGGAGVVQWAEGETGGEAFIPLHPSKRMRSAGILADVAGRFGYKLESFADGGIRAALSAGRGVEGNKYVWGGTGPTGFDCSGFVGWLQQIAMGIVDSTKRLYTTHTLIAGDTAGLVQGLGPAGTLFQVGVSDEHMAATIDGLAAESGGAHGTSGIGGGRASAQDSQFPYKFHLPNSMVADIAEGVYNTTGGQSRSSSSRSKSAPKWNDTDEEKLTSANIAVTQAEEARDKVYANDKKSEADREQADSKVRQAQNKAVDLQAKKDDAASYVADGPAPQAPALEKAYTEQELGLIDAQLAVDSANERRNEVYDNMDSTATELAKADADLSRAEQKLNDVLSGKDSGSGGGFSVKTRLRDYVTDIAGIGFDAMMAQVPFGIGESRWWDVGAEVAGLAGEASKNRLAPTPMFSDADVNSQLGFNPAEGMPEWFESLRKMAPKVYDTGGWLMPGETAINLSDRPEPIFNSPKQLAQFAGGLMPAAESGGTDYSINMGPVTVADPRQFEAMLKQKQMEQRARTSSRR
jgi:tape measure domain-containing protein